MFYGVVLESADSFKLSDFKRVVLSKDYLDKYKIKGIQPDDKTHKSIGWEYDEGKLVGFVDVYYDPSNEDFGERHCINNLEVDKKYRRKGLGTQILDYAVKSMKGDFIIVEASNKIAFEMYKKYGFKVGSDTEKKNGKIKYYQMYLKFPEGIEPINESSLKCGCLIVSCFAGIGKNYAIKYYRDKGYRVNSIEKTRDFNKQQFVNMINTLSKVSDILFIPYWLGMREYTKGINFLLVYPDRSLKSDYVRRFRQLGFTIDEVNYLISNWNTMIDDCETFERKVKITRPNEYLAEILDIILQQWR